jgi:hypothetical protein
MGTCPAPQEPIIANKKRIYYRAPDGRGTQAVIGIIAGILVARHLKTGDSPRTDGIVATAVQWAEIMRKVDNTDGREV